MLTAKLITTATSTVIILVL